MTPQERQLTDRGNVTNVDALSKIDNDGGLSAGEKNLLWVTHHDILAIHSEFKRQKWLRMKSAFQAGQFHC